VETIFTTLLSPTLAVLHSKFILSMLFGRTVIWSSQQRDARHVPLLEAVRNLWLPPSIGAGFLLSAWFVAPGAIPWLVPAVTGMLLAPLFAWVTSLPQVGEAAARIGLCAVPEEIEASREVSWAGFAAWPLERGAAGGGPSQSRLVGRPMGVAEPAASLQKSD
jgi:membrane glycosyltransferase